MRAASCSDSMTGGGLVPDGPAVADTTTADKVRRIVLAMAPQPPAELSDEHRLVEDLGFDSLRLMELTVVLERAFALPRFRPEELVGVRRVDAVIALISGTVAAADASGEVPR
ncbi:acyl carrier protein [Nocardia sp. NPDC049707]|uniref:acyl carrier protein n=1 Tax=Nocardia sp. NPDC049707 TaxID=3154735 RepID=UPI0034393890